MIPDFSVPAGSYSYNCPKQPKLGSLLITLQHLQQHYEQCLIPQQSTVQTFSSEFTKLTLTSESTDHNVFHVLTGMSWLLPDCSQFQGLWKKGRKNDRVWTQVSPSSGSLPAAVGSIPSPPTWTALGRSSSCFLLPSQRLDVRPANVKLKISDLMEKDHLEIRKILFPVLSVLLLVFS